MKVNHASRGIHQHIANLEYWNSGRAPGSEVKGIVVRCPSSGELAADAPTVQGRRARGERRR
jgi:hypothetical protein